MMIVERALLHPQIGGYTMIDQWPLKYLRTKQLLLRWMECSAFSDVMFRTHPGNLPTKSWQYNSDNATLVAFKTWASVHAALWPYRKGFVELASTTGVPVTRHPWLQYPGDSKVPCSSWSSGVACCCAFASSHAAVCLQVYNLTDQFMVGDAIMVAPVLGANVTSVQMYLPVGSGSWTHVWTGVSMPSPGWITMEAPIGQPAVAVRNSSPWASRLITALCGATDNCAT